jgi:hypothetical protein
MSRSLNKLSIKDEKYSIKQFRNPMNIEKVPNSNKVLPFEIPNIAYGPEHFKSISSKIRFTNFTDIPETALCKCGDCWVDFDSD